MELLIDTTGACTIVTTAVGEQPHLTSGRQVMPFGLVTLPWVHRGREDVAFGADGVGTPVRREAGLSEVAVMEESTSIGNPIEAAALVLIQFGGGRWRGLLETHVRDHSGHCQGCSSSSGATPVWPCSMWSIAERARILTSERARRQA